MSSLNDLRQIGAFVPDELVKKEIKFKLEDDADELVVDVHVRRLSVGTYEAIFIAAEPDKISRTAKLLSESIRLGENGEEILSYVDAYKLHPRIARAMTAAVNEVNGGERKN